MIYSNLILQKVQQQYLKTDIPNLEVGDTVRLGLLIKEGNKERTQYYEGVTISKKNSGINKTITVRRIMQGIGIERLFLIHSPKIASIEIKKSANVKRSKLYYLRNRSGKATRLKQKY
jgi:large subunit ribosomal protein L19|uniref:Large ribosomal subunit protein bL19c n=2 Tax=Heterosigma akashiwo TaxID=2829 RepID=A0A224AEQ3_HETAK|nr:50S ribosomal protein L19 [Heterosigma akashiwo]BBA18336.1 50S ribosomal protein L1 [Heterosigma akashiwo]BBA18475.1 50S ribosomal protein L1 [Heterosigma akashiwo]BBA18752.1 50S ribosomal protein L1 [Heterosigma akashiwo]